MPNGKRQQDVETLYNQAIGFTGEMREAFLEKACQGDQQLQAEVQTLLHHRSRIQTAEIARAAGLPDPLSGTASGVLHARIAGYKLLKIIGEGGMGVVYEAEQDHPRRKVALKLIRPGLASPTLLRRFEYETDVLARLEHPGIARIYHAGIADSGHGPQPYFAMELVAGRQLDDFVRDTSPSTQQRLELLIEICQAVHHAHTKGVIHRDLKPSNILITTDGQPKILDFGVARAIESDIQAATMATESGQLIGTLPYMSPEQAAGKVRELDTSSDVYALGVIAYELLCGAMPYSLAGKALHEAVRVICEQEPSRLSSINRSLRGDVETIVRKALEKDKTRRYHTAGELGADVKRFLDYEPITARPASTWYQLAKFTRRNKLLVGSAAAILIVLLVGIVGTSIGFVRARQQRAEADRQKQEAQTSARRSDAVNQFLRDMLGSADASNLSATDRAKGRDVTVLEALNEAGEKLDAGSLRDQPEIEFAVRHTIGMTYSNLGIHERAAHHLDQALALARLRGPVNIDVAGALSALGLMRWHEQHLPEAKSLLQQAAQMFRDLNEEAEMLTAEHNLSLVLQSEGNYRESEVVARRVLQRRRQLLGDENMVVATDVNTLGSVVWAQGKLEEAEAHFRESLRVVRKIVGEESPHAASVLSGLAGVLYQQGKMDESEQLLRRALTIRQKLVGSQHPHVATSLNDLATILQSRKKFDEAEALFREALEMRRRLFGDESTPVAQSLNNLGYLNFLQGRRADAERNFREAAAITRKLLGEHHPELANTLYTLGHLVQDEHRDAEAEPIFRELFEKAHLIQTDAQHRAAYYVGYGKCLVHLGRFADADAPLRTALEQIPASDSRTLRHRGEAIAAIIQVCDHTNRPEEAAKWRAELAALEASTRPSTQPATSPS